MQTDINYNYNDDDMSFVIRYAIYECCSFLLQKELNILYIKLKEIATSKKKLNKMTTIWENPFM